MAGVGSPGTRRAEIKLERLAQGHQSAKHFELGLSLQGHLSTGQFPAWGLNEEPIT